MKQEDLLATAKEIRREVRAKANLPVAWDRASGEMVDFYLLLARRAEGLEPLGHEVERLQ